MVQNHVEELFERFCGPSMVEKVRCYWVFRAGAWVVDDALRGDSRGKGAFEAMNKPYLRQMSWMT